MTDRALPWDDTEWEVEARDHIERLEKANPDRSQWIPSARWLAMALESLDYERSCDWERATTPSPYEGRDDDKG